MEREYLQLHSQIHFADLDASRNLQHYGSEVEDALDTACDQAVTHRLRGGGRGGDHADGDAALGAHPRDVVRVRHREAAARHAAQVRVQVEQRFDREAAPREAAVVGQRVTQVADAAHGHLVLPGQAEDALDLADQD